VKIEGQDTIMSDAAAIDAPVKKGGKMKKMLLIGGGAILLLGGGVAAGMYASGAGLASGHEEVEDPNMPKLVLKDGGEEKAPKGDKPLDPAKYKASYYVIEKNFTSNMRDSDGFVQVTIGVSSYYDQRVLDRLKEHEMAVRSAVLMVLADQDSFVITTPEGRANLQVALKKAINDTLTAKEGFGGIDSVYFTSFIIS
jgi:flagellar FliL protein